MLSGGKRTQRDHIMCMLCAMGRVTGNVHQTDSPVGYGAEKERQPEQGNNSRATERRSGQEQGLTAKPCWVIFNSCAATWLMEFLDLAGLPD